MAKTFGDIFRNVVEVVEESPLPRTVRLLRTSSLDYAT